MEQLNRKPRLQQINQTRAWVAEALMQLMEEQPFATITLVRVAERSGLARQTLHRHFVTLEEVLLWYIEHTFETFAAHLSSLDATSPEGIELNNRRALQVCGENRRFLGLLHRHGLGHLFLAKIEVFAGVIGFDDPYRRAYFAGGFHHVVMTWTASETPWEEDRLAVLLGQLIAATSSSSTPR